MDAKTLAAQLNGIDYPCRISKELEAQAKAAGLVIVFGASDDLMEFRGAIYDELSAYDGTTAYVDTTGLLPEREQLEEDDELQAYFARKPHAVEIKQIWNDHSPLCWTHETSIPHEKFEIWEDGEVSSTGIVFALADAKAVA